MSNIKSLMFYINQLYRTSRYFAAILALSLPLSLSCGDDDGDSTTVYHDFCAPNALTIVSDPGDPEKELLFVSNSTEGTVSIVDLTDNSPVDSDGNSSNGTNPISVSGITTDPDTKIIRDIAAAPDGSLLLVAWSSTNSGFLSKIDTSGIFTTGSVSSPTTIPLPGQPHSIAITSGTVLVTCTEPDSILSFVCSGTTYICEEKGNILLDNSPRNLINSEDDRFAYLTFFDSDEIATISMTGPLTLVAPLLSEGTVSGTPFDLAINPDTGEAYVTVVSPTSPQLAVVDISSPTQGQLLSTSYVLGGLPRRVAVTPIAINANGTTNRLVYVTNLNGAVQIIDDSTATEPEFIDSGEPSNPEITPISTMDRATKTEDWTLTYLSGTNKYLAVGTSSGTQVAMAEEGVVYVSDSWEVCLIISPGTQVTTEGDKFIFSTNSGISAISLEYLPGDIVISPGGEKAYIANTGSDSISIVDTKKSEVTGTLR
ncbi:MAG: hypothetical protein JSU92_10275 [Deltaproteobacteria bacterium]|nr:MAG: hypothetical protein JSU92_10275 [Deltaproteobacteria bacterium]